MKKLYIQSISTFAIGVPILIVIVALLALTVIKSTLIGDFETSKMTFSNEQIQVQALSKLKKEHTAKKAELQSWTKLLKGDSFTKVNEQLREAIVRNSKTRTLQLTEQNRASRPSFYVDSPRSACDFVLEGTFSELQRCMTELECKMPNLMVNTMSLTPQRKGKFLKLKLNYTIWEQAQ